jgi:ArsR family transcriptional regulator
LISPPIVAILMVIEIRSRCSMDPRRQYCPPVLQTKLGDADAKQLATAFKAIADPARLRLLSLLAAQPSGEACVCHFSHPLGLAQPTVSHHLKVLHQAGLVARERRGTWIYYRILPERFAALRNALAASPRQRPLAAPAGTAPRVRRTAAAPPRRSTGRR